MRRVLALQHSGGTLTSPTSVLHLLAAQYRFFVPSVLLALAAFLTVVRRVLRCYLARNWEPAQDNALLFSWLVTGIVVFGLSSLKFPQYFVLILMPGYCFLWTEMARWDWRPAWKRTVMAAAAVAGLGSFLLTVPAFSVNTLAPSSAVRGGADPGEWHRGHRAEHRRPDPATVVHRRSRERPACMPQPTRLPGGPTCSRASQQGDSAFHQLMTGAVPVKSFSGAVGTATVWKLRQAP